MIQKWITFQIHNLTTMSFDQSLNLSRQQINSQKSSFISNVLDMKTEDSRKAKKKNSKSMMSSQQQGAFYEFTEVFVWGDDSFGQLGLYHQKLKKGTLDQMHFKIPKTCSFNILISQVSCGLHHSAILTTQGHLYMMGSNTDGQLGIGDNCPDLNNKSQAGAPCLVDTLKDLRVISVQCGSNFTLALAESKENHKQNQFVYGWGSNIDGQLGFTQREIIEQPRQIAFFLEQKLDSISGGLNHSLFVTNQGEVYGCGSNEYGELGISDSVYSFDEPVLLEELSELRIVQAKAGYNYSLFLTEEGEVWGCGTNTSHELGVSEVHTTTFKPLKIHNLSKIRTIDARGHSAAITTTGELFLWGKGVFGTYRQPQKILTISNKVEHVCIGETLGAAVDCKGLLWTWGFNHLGELGVGDNDPRIHPYPVLSLKGKQVTQIQCGGSFVVALGQNLRKEIPGLNLKKKKADEKSRVTQLHRHNSSHKSLGRSLSKKKNSSVTNLHRQSSTSSMQKVYGRDKSNSGISSPKLSQKLGKKRSSKGSLQRKSLDISKIKNKRSQSKPPFSGEDTSSFLIKHSNLNGSGIVLKKKTKHKQSFEVANLIQSPNSKKIRPDPLDQVGSNDVTSDSMGHMFIPSALQTQTNKEKIIKDLTLENKQLRTENDILKKEHRHLRQQIEGLEKQIERHKITPQHQQEMQMLYGELKKKDMKVTDIKKKKKQFKERITALESKLERVHQERDCFMAERDHVLSQMKSFQDEYQKLQSKLLESETNNQQCEEEIKEFKHEVAKIGDQSKEVEKSLLLKLQELSEKYRDAVRQNEESAAKYKQDVQKFENMQLALKDNQYYVNAVERENAFLREEIERAKYSKDKAEYSRFISGLVPIRGSRKPCNDENSQPSYRKEARSPFKEVSRKNEKQELELKSSYVYQKAQDSKNDKVQSPKEEADWVDLKLSYNQKLLKSLEKKASASQYHR